MKTTRCSTATTGTHFISFFIVFAFQREPEQQTPKYGSRIDFSPIQSPVFCPATSAEDTLVRNSLLFIHLPAMMMTVNGQIPILFIRICLKFVCFCVPAAASTTSHRPRQCYFMEWTTDHRGRFSQCRVLRCGITCPRRRNKG